MRLDCLYEAEDGYLIDLEIQRQKKPYDPDRLVNYLTGMNQLLFQKGRSHSYGQCTMIFFSTHRFGEQRQQIQTVEMRLPSGTSITDQLQILSVQLTDLHELAKAEIETLSRKQRIMLYMKYAHRKEYLAMIQQICEKEEGLMAIHNWVLSEQEALQQYYHFRDMVDEAYDEREKEELRQQVLEEQQKRKEEQQRHRKERNFHNYILKLIEQGYSVADAKKKAIEKFDDIGSL